MDLKELIKMAENNDILPAIDIDVNTTSQLNKSEELDNFAELENNQHNEENLIKHFIVSTNNEQIIPDEVLTTSDNQISNTNININGDIKYHDDKIEYIYTTLSDDKSIPSVYKEIIRYHCINGLNNYFQIKLKELNLNGYNTSELFKNNSCKLIELINRWCWHQYNNPTHVDEVIPYVSDNNYDYERFVNDLNYILEIYGLPNAVKINDKIIIELKHLISEYLTVEWSNFKSRENINLKVSKDFVEKKIRLMCSYKQNTYQVIIYSKVYTRLKTKLIMFGKKYEIMKDYDGDLDDLLDQYIFCLVFRYSYMDSGNQQLAISQSIKDMYKECGVDFELFGSAINTVSTNYCSLFYDIEKFFGSQGNFFDFQINQGVYWCNPPYDDTIMKNAAYKLLEALQSDKEIAFLITIPIWDLQTQKIMRDQNINGIVRNHNKDTKPEEHIDFQIYSIIKPYIKDELIVPKHRIPYFNYKKYSHISAVNTYMLIVYNTINENVKKNLHYNFDRIIELDKNNFFCRN